MLSFACSPPPEPIHVRGGVVVQGRAEGQALPGGRTLVEEQGGPRVAECVTLFSVPLGDASGVVARGGESPDAALAFSPDGSRLAVGTYLGDVLLLDAWTGAVLARTHLSESLVKAVAFSPDGAVVYAAEQSPDAWLYALDDGLAPIEKLRLADDVEPSAPPEDDLYGLYSLPAAYGLEVLPDGELVVAAAHGWGWGDERRNRAKVLRLGPRLERRAGWPAVGAADAVLGSLAVGPGWVAVSLRRSAAGPAPAGLPLDGVLVLSLPGLVPERSFQLPPLLPWYPNVFVWEAVAAVGDRLVVGTGDGRLAVERGPVEGLGTPITEGGIPIAASVGFVATAGDEIVAVTARTDIPYGAASPELRPPRAHPAENALHAFHLEGDRLVPSFRWQGPHDLAGLTVGGGEIVVGAGPRRTDARTDLFGVLVFDAAGEGAGAERLRAVCGTDGPVFFRHERAADGRIAVVEVPWRDGDDVRGGYRVTVLR